MGQVPTTEASSSSARWPLRCVTEAPVVTGALAVAQRSCINICHHAHLRICASAYMIVIVTLIMHGRYIYIVCREVPAGLQTERLYTSKLFAFVQIVPGSDTQ